MDSHPPTEQTDTQAMAVAVLDSEQKHLEGERCSGGSSENWWEKLRMQMRLMRSALEESSAGPELDSMLRKLLSDYLHLYNDFSQISVQKGVSGRNSPSAEAVFGWLGGWRPTSALVLVNSLFGGDFQGRPSTSAATETHISELSEKQLSSLNNLQKHTQQAENDLSYQLAVFQMLLADQTMVKAFVSEDNSIRSAGSEAQELIKSRFQSLLELLKQAENLRLETLQDLLNLLNPVQAARCSIAAFELAFALKTWSATSIGDSFSVPQKSQPTDMQSAEISEN